MPQRWRDRYPKWWKGIPVAGLIVVAIIIAGIFVLSIPRVRQQQRVIARQELLPAVRALNVADVQWSLERGIAADIAASEGFTPLQFAAGMLVWGQEYVPFNDLCPPFHAQRTSQSQIRSIERLIELLLAHGANPNVREPHGGNSPLDYACKSGNLRIAKALLEAGASTVGRATDIPGVTIGGPLVCSLREGHIDVALLLLDYGASTKQTIVSAAPHFELVRNRDFDSLARFLAKCKCMDNELTDNLTLLQNAAMTGDLDLVQFALEHGADVDAAPRERSLSPVHQAARNGHVDVVLHLIANGASRDLGDYTILRELGRAGRDVYEEYLAKSADPLGLSAADSARKEWSKPGILKPPTDWFDQYTDTSHLMRAIRENRLGPLEEMLKQNLALETIEHSRHPFTRAVQMKHFEAADLLLHQHIDINMGLNQGFSLVHNVQALSGDFSRLDYLLSRGAIIDDMNEVGNSLLYRAVEFQNTDLVRHLILNNANVNFQNRRGSTPLHCAAGIGEREIAVYLIEHGARLDIVNQLEYNPVEFAAFAGRPDMAEFLIQYARDHNIDVQYSLTPKYAPKKTAP